MPLLLSRTGWVPIAGAALLVLGMWQLATVSSVRHRASQSYQGLYDFAGQLADKSRPHPKSASNATLGFQSIQFINLDYRYDLHDVMTMQAKVSGLDISTFSAVDAQDLDAHESKGMPPSSRPLSDSETDRLPLKLGAQACFRSHANLWSKMIDEGIRSMLILESDATWDLNIRNQTQRISEGLVELMKLAPNTSDGYAGSTSYENLVPTEDDPYLVDNWDILSFGQCYEDNMWHDEFLRIDDPDGPKHMTYYDEEYEDSRVIRRTGGPVCTNAYAISQTGAMKLLLRSSIDLNVPVDIMINGMGTHKLLNGYSIVPPIFGQWEYKDGIGADDLNSSIQEHESGQLHEKAAEIWAKIHDSFNVWQIKGEFRSTEFRNPVLGVLAEAVFGKPRTGI